MPVLDWLSVIGGVEQPAAAANDRRLGGAAHDLSYLPIYCCLELNGSE